jgi:hypothetical protein
MRPHAGVQQGRQISADVRGSGIFEAMQNILHWPPEPDSRARLLKRRLSIDAGGTDK